MNAVARLVAAFLLVPTAALATGAESDADAITFAETSPLAETMAVAQRLLNPITYDRVVRFSAERNVDILAQDIVPANEVYDLVVPPLPASGKYGVLVFVPPDVVFPITPAYRAELRRRGLIYIAARKSGNQENVLARRVPLALHGLNHVLANYPVDPARVYVTGFSGGSRVAQRLAMGWPEVFSAVLLVGGSDRIGSGEDYIVPPPAAQMERFQRDTRVVFATGGDDSPNRAKDGHVREMFAEYCVAHVSTVAQRGLPHWMPDGKTLRKALDALETPVAEVPGNAECRAALLRRVAADLDATEAAIAAGDRAEAKRRMLDVDSRWGGLASPRIEAIDRRFEAAFGRVDD